MSHDADILTKLAANRRARIGDDGRPRFDLTQEELERSTEVAMRLADASKSQIEQRQAEHPSAVG